MKAHTIKYQSSNLFHNNLGARLDLIILELHGLAREVEGLKKSPSSLSLAKSLRFMADSTATLKSPTRAIELTKPHQLTKRNSPNENHATSHVAI